MAEPECPQKYSYAVDLDPGDYWWCSCGKSKSQPFCDGSHKYTDFEPVKITIDESTRVWLCGCKKTEDTPFCDGSHKQLV